jgi:aldehyde dehydrogenase (NAD+)
MEELSMNIIFERLESYIDPSEIALGGESDRSSLFISPTILKSTEGSPSMKEEIFGPVLPMLTINSQKEAIEFIKQRPHPLAAYAFSRNSRILDEFENEVSSGGMCLNDSLVHLSSETLPFGGVGESGMGSYHGKRSFEIFSHYKSVMRRGFLDLPVRYPPYEGKLGLIRKLLSFLG